MKLQSMEEIMDESCEIIKKTKLSPELKMKLTKENEILMKEHQKAVPAVLEK